MEFMLSEALPIYSGGLGNVAGDQLKAASDLGVPVVGVGLLYQQGYFRQVIDKDGAQQALFPYNDPGQLPITPLRQPNGEWLRLEIALPGYSVWLRAWQVQVGRVKLYLLDSNDAANFPAHRGITSELYGGGPELRLKQELVLGIGGWRLLAALGHPAGSLPPERRACGLRRAGARPQFHGRDRAALRSRAGRHASGQPLHHPHGGGRRASTVLLRLSSSNTSGGYAEAEARHHAPRFAGPGPPEPERLVGEFQHGLSGDPRERGGQRREPLAREGEPAALSRRSFRAGRRTKCRSDT